MTAQILGTILIVIGVIIIIAGIVAAVIEMFKKPEKVRALREGEEEKKNVFQKIIEAITSLIKALGEAPRWLAICFIGIILIIGGWYLGFK
jgi:uncharacterized membrane protein